MKVKYKAFYISVPIYTCLNAFVLYFEVTKVGLYSETFLWRLFSIFLILLFSAALAATCFYAGALFAFILVRFFWPGGLEKHRNLWSIIGASSLNLIAIVFWL
jgi:hypothetical protein